MPDNPLSTNPVAARPKGPLDSVLDGMDDLYPFPSEETVPAPIAPQLLEQPATEVPLAIPPPTPAAEPPIPMEEGRPAAIPPAPPAAPVAEPPPCDAPGSPCARNAG